MFEKNELIIDMHIDGKPITHFLSFDLKQRFNAHHVFELRLEHGKLGIPGLINLDESRDFVGRRLAISFGYKGEDMNNFVGIITHVGLIQSHGFQGVLMIQGYSPTILIDRGADLGSYYQQTLSSIVDLACTGVDRKALELKVAAARSTPIDYILQYKESDFDFLNRLSAAYYEWFYYDGERLHFGRPADRPTATLTYGREVKLLEYGMYILPVNQHVFSYMPQADDLLIDAVSPTTKGHPDQTFAINRSSEIYKKTYNQQAEIRMESFHDLKILVEAQEEASIGELLVVRGESDSPQLRIGSDIQLNTSLRQEMNFVTDSLGKFLIREVDHYIDANGRYQNSFSGILSSTECLHVGEYKQPQADMQMADVMDNNDPQGQGRVRVQFKWHCSNNDVSAWLRVVSPNAGSGSLGANRGFFAIPEVGDQVMVAFEEGNIARPVVLGSVYNKSNVDSRPQVENHLKSITTRSGHLIEFDDASGSQGIKVTDIKGNILHIDSVGNNITLTALEGMTLNCKNMQINVGENMDIRVGQDQRSNIGNNQSTNVSRDMSTVVGNDYVLTASGDIAESSDHRQEMVTKDFSRQSETSDEQAGEMTVFSRKENMRLQSGKVVDVKSAEKSQMF